MADSAIKLHYFPVRGRGEISRLVLHAAKRNFVDDRIAPADWANVKPKTPYGALPYLEVGDEAFCQSQAIASFLAREAGLYGSTNIDALKIEQMLQFREDLIIEEVKAWKEKDAAKKAEINKNLNENLYPRVLGVWEKMIKENQTKSGTKFSVGNKLSLADIVIFEGTVTLSQNKPALLDTFPAVKAVASMVTAVDGIKQYVEKRSKTDI